LGHYNTQCTAKNDQVVAIVDENKIEGCFAAHIVHSLSAILNNIVTSDSGSTILSTSVNNVGSKTLFNPVTLVLEYYFNTIIYAIFSTICVMKRVSNEYNYLYAIISYFVMGKYDSQKKIINRQLACFNRLIFYAGKKSKFP
jgi:hypothetical protein